VVDTSVAESGRKRPDLLAYLSRTAANLVLSAEIVVEAKQPDEIRAASLSRALVQDPIWSEKTFPYVKANLATVRYFVLTTFAEFAVVEITPDVRNAFEVLSDSDSPGASDLQHLLGRDTIVFELTGDEAAANGPNAWIHWLEVHLSNSALTPPPLSTIRNVVSISDGTGLEWLAGRLAAFAAGTTERTRYPGFFELVLARIPRRFADLPNEVRRDLVLFLMSQEPGLDAARAERRGQTAIDDSLEDFVAASLHSLISRLFAIKAIEDIFCVDQEVPLIERDLWLFSSSEYDSLAPAELRRAVFEHLHALAQSDNHVVSRFTRYGFFFDWIEEYLDPVEFMELFKLFVVSDFTSVEGDILGRFYELYAQEVNRSKRRELGQYYTPLPIVRFMWWLALRYVEGAGDVRTVTVLASVIHHGESMPQRRHLEGSCGFTRIMPAVSSITPLPQHDAWGSPYLPSSPPAESIYAGTGRARGAGEPRAG
jgi:hypothetical protein